MNQVVNNRSYSTVVEKQKQDKVKCIVQVSFCFILLLTIIILGTKLLGADFRPALLWWLTVFMLGLIVFPLTASFFRKFNDKGYLFAKMIGLAFVGFGVWFVANIHLMKFTRTTCVVICILATIIIYGYYIVKYYIRKKKPEFLMDINWSFILKCILEELVFLLLFVLFLYIKGMKPEASGTEKFMDYGFMTVMNRSDYMPAQDLWFAGETLNYYYGGQYMATFLTKLSGVKISYGYNLMLMMITAICTMLPYSFTLNLLGNVKDKSEKRRCHCIFTHIGGVISALAVTFAGSMHFTYYKLLVPAITKFLSIDYTIPRYWFPDATRYIGYQPDIPDKTIHEFPNYSFVLGDLHAHVVNMIFVLSLLGLLLAWQLNKEENVKKEGTLIELVKSSFHSELLVIAFLIGIFHMTNYWDFPIYYVVSGAVILFTNLKVYKKRGYAFLCTAIQGVYMLIIAKIVYLPFALSFDKISTEIAFTGIHSAFRQLVVLWGLPVVTIIGFILFRIIRYKNGTSGYDSKDWSHIDRFAILLGLCAIGLVLMPEIVYVKDIYSASHKRANTMFKLTYQAFLMMGLLFGYIFVRLVAFKNKLSEKKFSILCFLVFLTTLGYSGIATKEWFGDITKPERYQSLDCSAFLENKFSKDYGAIKWLNENVEGTPVILEVNGLSYTDYERVSVFTGLPTVLGWRTHEWLWRGDTKEVDLRSADIEIIYTGDDKQATFELIKKYQIEYIIVGSIEYNHFDYINHTLLQSLGEVVYRNDSMVTNTPTYIIKIEK